MTRLFLFLGLILSTLSFACDISDIVPQDPSHPASPQYNYGSKRIIKKIKDRELTLYLPMAGELPRKKAPIVVFGHAKMTPRFLYEQTFRHLNGKGVAVIYPHYERWWFDAEYSRMARDFMNIAAEVVYEYAEELDKQHILFAGHANGASIALTAAGLTMSERKLKPKAFVGFATTSWRNQYLERLPINFDVTLIVGDEDRKAPYASSENIYQRLDVDRKQIIELSSFYQQGIRFKANHTAAYTYGWTGKRINLLHYHGYWKYLSAAAMTLDEHTPYVQRHIYGDLAASTFCDTYDHRILRSW